MYKITMFSGEEFKVEKDPIECIYSGIKKDKSFICMDGIMLNISRIESVVDKNEWK